MQISLQFDEFFLTMMYILGYCALNLLFFLSDDDDDEEDLSLNERSDSNWTEQISFSSSGWCFDNFKPSNNSSTGGRGGGSTSMTRKATEYKRGM